MAEMTTTGTWLVDERKQAAFLEAWVAFAGWASSVDGAGTLRLGRAGRDPGQFVSFGAWQSAELAHAWKAHPEFQERIASVLQHVDQFLPTELEVVATASDGRAALSPLSVARTS